MFFLFCSFEIIYFILIKHFLSFFMVNFLLLFFDYLYKQIIIYLYSASTKIINIYLLFYLKNNKIYQAKFIQISQKIKQKNVANFSYILVIYLYA